MPNCIIIIIMTTEKEIKLLKQHFERLGTTAQEINLKLA